MRPQAAIGSAIAPGVGFWQGVPMTKFVTSLHSWMSAVSDIARAVNNAEPLDLILTRVADQACALIGFDFCAVMLADTERDRVRVAGWSGLTSNYISLVSDDHALMIHPLDRGLDSPAARAYREGCTITVADTHDAGIYGRLSRLAPAQGYRSLLASPLRSSEEVLGILVGYLERPHVFDSSDVELAELLAEQTAIAIHTAQLRAAQQEVIGELREQRTVLDWAEQQHSRLMQLVLDDMGLVGLVEALADILQASVTVEDAGAFVLASASDGSYVTPPGADTPRRSPAGRMPEPSRYEVVKVTGDDGEAWFAPVVLSGELVGRLWVTGSAHPPGPGQRRVIERFALVVGVEVLKRRHLVDVEERLSGDLMADLMRPDGVSQPRAVLDRAGALGHDLAVPHWLGLLALDHDDPVPGRFADLVRAAAGTDVPLLMGRYEDSLVLLLPAAVEPMPVFRRIHEQAALHAAPTPVSLIVSSYVAELGDYSHAYQLATGASRLRRLSERGGLVDLRALSVTSLLLISGTLPIQLQHFATTMIEPLQSYDARRNTDLVRTLRAWLNAGFSTVSAAEILVVHVNTVAYRLARIEALVQRDLRRSDTRLEIQLALHVWDVLTLDDVS